MTDNENGLLDLLKKEIRVLHEAAEITAGLVIQQFKQTEQEKCRYQEAAANLEGFKRTLDQTSDCVFMFDPQTFLFNYVNSGGQTQSGYSEEELFSMSFVDLTTSLSMAQFKELQQVLSNGPTVTPFRACSIT
jgi:PAS domain-containing protein